MNIPELILAEGFASSTGNGANPSVAAELPALNAAKGRGRRGGKAPTLQIEATSGDVDQDERPCDPDPLGSAKPKPPTSKTEMVLKKLRSAKGATLEALREATGWQAHSVRGFLSGTVRKKLGQTVASEVGKDGARRYRIETPHKAK
ncbi:DUF3489 domain-containing protein [Mesorhizobium sp. IMUNJ 23232]|uniref:DUF3489 domain-containing protein n=1 Tax=Mesorhizobium sp. IMUNJ 23232 TaxID=3376064 RepID=UPI0037B93548